DSRAAAASSGPGACGACSWYLPRVHILVSATPSPRVAGWIDNDGMLEIGTTVLTVEDMDRAGDFWRTALGYVNRREPSDDWVILDPPEGAHGRASIALSKTGYPQHYPPRLHLDLYASDQQAELARLRS